MPADDELKPVEDAGDVPGNEYSTGDVVQPEKLRWWHFRGKLFLPFVVFFALLFLVDFLVVRGRTQAVRMQCMGRLYEICFAGTDYCKLHPDDDPFADVVDENENAIHSWRVNVAHLLHTEWNEMDENERYRFDEPWNSEHNLAFAEKNDVDTFTCPADAGGSRKNVDRHEIGRSSYVKVTGAGHLLPEENSVLISNCRKKTRRRGRSRAIFRSMSCLTVE